jgi:phosphatidylinositol alpha-mannosyltransferase
MTGGSPASRLRIGICASYDLARAGGVNTHIRAQAAALRRLGHDVCIFGASSAPLPDGEVSLGGCVSLVIGATQTGFGIDPRAWWTAKRLLRERRFDLVHMHEPLMPLPSWFVLRQATVPIVATFHTYREHGHKWYPAYRWLFDPLMKRVTVRLAVSEAAKRTVAAHFPGDYEVIPNAIDIARFSSPAPRPTLMPAGRSNVLYVGRLEPRKGVERLLEAMTAVQRHVSCAQLVIVGDGPDRARLESHARELNVNALFAGRVSDGDLPGFYRAADVVCSPALRDESFGIVLLEAMAAGRPIVATNIAGYAELLDPAGCARLVDPDDATSLAREISTILGEPALARTLGEHGAAAARQYDWTVVASRLEEIYYDAVGRSTSGAAIKRRR